MTITSSNGRAWATQREGTKPAWNSPHWNLYTDERHASIGHLWTSSQETVRKVVEVLGATCEGEPT